MKVQSQLIILVSLIWMTYLKGKKSYCNTDQIKEDTALQMYMVHLWSGYGENIKKLWSIDHNFIGGKTSKKYGQ